MELNSCEHKIVSRHYPNSATASFVIFTRQFVVSELSLIWLEPQLRDIHKIRLSYLTTGLRVCSQLRMQ